MKERLRGVDGRILLFGNSSYNSIGIKAVQLNLSLYLWATRPKTNRFAYYSYLAKRARHRKGAEIGKDVEVEYKGMRFLIAKGFTETFHSAHIDVYEPLTWQFMTGQGGDVFVDVGANGGGYTVRLGNKFRKVISVEPNPKVFAVLRRNVELNHLSNVDVINAAMSDTVGETTMYVPSSGKTTRSSIIEKYDHGSSFPVRTTTLDALLADYERIDLIKIDVEGAEVRVLNGAEKTLQKTSRLVLELGPWSEPRIKEILERCSFVTSDLDLKEKSGKNVLVERGPKD